MISPLFARSTTQDGAPEEQRSAAAAFSEALKRFETCMKLNKHSKEATDNRRSTANSRGSFVNSLMNIGSSASPTAQDAEEAETNLNNTPSLSHESKEYELDETQALNGLIAAAVSLAEEKSDARAFSFDQGGRFALLRGTEEVLEGQLEYMKKCGEDEVAAELENNLTMWRTVKDGGDYLGEHFVPPPLSKKKLASLEQKSPVKKDSYFGGSFSIAKKDQPEDENENASRVLQNRRRKVAAIVKASLDPQKSSSHSGIAEEQEKETKNLSGTAERRRFQNKRGVSESSLKAKEIWTSAIDESRQLESPKEREDRIAAKERAERRHQITQQVQRRLAYKAKYMSKISAR